MTSIANGVKHVVAIRSTNVAIDTVSARASVEVAIPGSDPTGFALKSSNQPIAVQLVDISKTAALFVAVSDSLSISQGFLTNGETSHGISSEKSKNGANNGSFERHLFTGCVWGVRVFIFEQRFVCLHVIQNRKFVLFLFWQNYLS
jgi:hypothetical protein